jgi:hemerythrin
MTQWTEALSTGVPLLDEHHKAIFQWLDELESAAVEERRLFGAYAVTRLTHYVREHFMVEEALMKSAGYPGLAEHMAEHAVFRAKLKELQLKSVGQDISQEAVEFLRDWLGDHITCVDMAYVPYLNR